MGELSDKMRELARTHERGGELIQRADEMDAAWSDDNKTVPQKLGSWARARRLWCELTGEDLA